jgi:pyruvate dehydrogenase E2 component (dihydrolipoamide acetyltransferase)
MATEVKLPELGENLTGGEVSDVKVAVGDTVTEGQALIEIDAEKSTVEVPSPMSGKIQKLLVKKGDTIQVGQALCVIEASTEAKAETPKPPSKAPARETEAPKPAPVETKKTEIKPSETNTAAPPAKAPQRAEPAGNGRVIAAGPATRHLARELGVDLALVTGTGPSNRVTQDDVKAFVRDLATGPQRGGGGPVIAPPLPDFAKWGEVEKQPLDAIRRKTAEQMSLAWSLIPHVTHHDLADITDLEAYRKEYDGKGPKLTVTAFALKAVAIALREFPQFNASLDLAGGQLIVKRYYHIGVAVDTERGLLVPVLRDVNTKSVRALAQELTDMAEKTRQKKTQPEDLRGGTFTITNLGGIGGTGFTPIVNYPEVAILGLSRSRMQPTVHDGQIVPRLQLPLSLSYDHRVIDGANAARFTRRIAEMLENPMIMVLDG